MRKLSMVFVLLLFTLLIALSGCGGGNGNNEATLTRFILPGEYMNSQDHVAIEGNLTAKFYFISLSDLNAFLADQKVFTSDGGFVGKTGTNGSNIGYQIPINLDEQKRVAVTLIILDPQYNDFDLVGLSKDDLYRMTSSGKVVFGYTSDQDIKTLKENTLSKAGGTVDGFNMIDLSQISTVFASPTHFILPSFYFTAMNFSTYAGIPDRKTIKLYTITPQGLYVAMNGLGPFATDATISGTTGVGDSDVIYYVTDALQNQDRIIVSLIILDPVYEDFDLNGKTLLDLAGITEPGKVVIGFTFDRTTYQPRTTLLSKDGKTVGDFLLIDASVYRPQMMNGEARILKGKTIKKFTF